MKTLLLGALLVLLSACATQKEWAATGGSRADGVIRLSYEHGMMEQPVLNEEQAVNIAAARCKAWGYEEAEAFGGTRRVCNGGSGGMGGGCNSWLVTKEYQCINRLK